MGYIKISVEDVQRIGSLLQQNATARENDVTSLSSSASPEAFWEGAAASAYTEKYNQWRAAERNLIQALHDLGHVINTIANNFDQVNQSGASAMGG
ncbi:WXG100 family type VII secretion target [Streptomyces sp. NBC_00433]